MRPINLLLSLALAPWLYGCGTIYSAQPFGNEIAVFDPQRINGLWLAGDGSLIGVRVVDATNGVVTTWLAKARPDSDKQIALRCHPPVVSNPTCSYENALGTCMKEKKSTCTDHAVAACAWRHYDVLYFPAIADAKKDAYATEFGLFISKPEKEWPLAVLMHVKHGHNRIDSLIDEGKLPGRRDESGTRILGPLSLEHYKLIFSKETDPFDIFPGRYVFTKLPDEIDPCKKGGATN